MWSMDDWKYVERQVVTDPQGRQWSIGLMDVLALSGHPGENDREHGNCIPEVFTPAPPPRGRWHRLGSYRVPQQDMLFRDHETTYYPRAHLLPTGDILLASPARNRTVTLRVNRNPLRGMGDSARRRFCSRCSRRTTIGAGEFS